MSYEIIRPEKKQRRRRSLINSLPGDLIIDILVRLSRFNYPNLSLVSKHFESLVASPDLYARRALLGYTEPCIYVLLRCQDTGDYLLYLLRRKANRKRLVFIRVLPPRSSIVTVGSKIYVFGGIYDFKLTTTLFSIDCGSHTVQPLPNMPMPIAGKLVKIIDRKIYIIGYCDDHSKKKVMVVFDTETQMWEAKMTKVDLKIGHIWASCCVVMADKMYMRDSNDSFIYEPKENKWETEAMLNSEKWENACFIDDVLYYYDYDQNKLRAYDTKQRLWTVVKGVSKLFSEDRFESWCSNTVNYGGNLVVFLDRYIYESSGRITKIWCANIALERRRGGEIWGTVEWSNVLLEGSLLVMKYLVVTV